MIVENKLTSYLFKDLPPVSPTTWDLSSFIPEGIGLLEHLQYRHRMPDQYISPWYPVQGFNRATQVATASVPDGAMFVEFRRKTPRYELIRDPLDKASRVAQPDLQLNADQGMFVALEWAAEYGIDGHAQMVSGNPPLSIGRVMHTQLHFGPEANYFRKVWNFRFAGGYMEPEHVRVQIKVAGVWQPLTIDCSEYDPEAPSAAPYKLQDPFQLYLDFGELASQIEGMVIYRRTPREYPVSTPSHRSQITAEGMTPSATQAFFVAVELGEEMNRNVPHCECLQVFTSEPYPVVMPVESFGVNASKPEGGGKLTPQPEIRDSVGMALSAVEGTLRTILQQYTYWPAEYMTMQMAALSGILKQVLFFYTDWPHEDMGMTVAATAGTLVVTLAPYSNWPHEDLSMVVSAQSGTLA